MTLYVFGHPRSGTHYLGALMRANGFGSMRGKPVSARSRHIWPSSLDVAFDAECNHSVYIWRSWSGVGPSMMAWHRDRMEPITLQEFSSTPWVDLVKKGLIDHSVTRGWLAEDQLCMAPYEGWKDHVAKWLDFAGHRTNVFPVRYEDLMSNFQDTMSSIAECLRLPRDNFINIYKKADSADVREGGFQPEGT